MEPIEDETSNEPMFDKHSLAKALLTAVATFVVARAVERSYDHIRQSRSVTPIEE